jgi:hypothetical protein
MQSSSTGCSNALYNSEHAYSKLPHAMHSRQDVSLLPELTKAQQRRIVRPCEHIYRLGSRPELVVLGSFRKSAPT